MIRVRRRLWLCDSNLMDWSPIDKVSLYSDRDFFIAIGEQVDCIAVVHGPIG
jgi:hypothetical protein